MSDLFVFAGEVSGDLHGEEVLRSLKELSPSLRVVGVGGPRMRSVGMECVMPMEEFQVMGFVDVFFALPKLMKKFYALSRTILEMQPKAVLFIDYPGFNLRLATHLRKKGFQGKICHYISPSVWAWGKKRIPLMAKTLDLLMTIFPFEAPLFSQTALDVQYVGHPLVSRIAHYKYQDIFLPKEKRLISLFPGSRKKEILRNLSFQLQAAKTLKEKYPDLLFAISVSQEQFIPLIEQKAKELGIESPLLVGSDKTYELMRASHAAIAKSGTVTLELALHQIPTVVTYAISPLDLLIARDLLRIRLSYYSLPNLILNEEVFPELFGPNFTLERLITSLEPLLSSEARERCLEKCKEVCQKLQTKEASQEVAALLNTQMATSSL